MFRNKKITIATGLVAIVSAIVGIICYKRKQENVFFTDFSSMRCKNCGMYFCHGECKLESVFDEDFEYVEEHTEI